VIGPELARELVRTFAEARFSGAERHVRRLAEVAKVENDNVAHTRATAKEIETRWPLL
jgi:ribose 5-phosphate isomerase RpiB